MPHDPGSALRDALAPLDPRHPDHVVAVVKLLLTQAQAAHASDVHIQPATDSVQILYRLDGVHPVAQLPASLAPNLAARLKVLADLLTYRTDLPQEGRIRNATADEPERRVSTFPTLHGERVVIRLFQSSGRFDHTSELGLPHDTAQTLKAALASPTGAIVISGPSGSGKTTTLYACLRDIAANPDYPRSIVTLEDPIEAALPGIAQSQVNAAAGFDLPRGLKSLVRQDPEVIAIGEIRDPASAEIALSAALTGQLVLTTFHTGSAVEVLSRLLDMGLEPYILRSALRLIIFQRLVRRLCTCARPMLSDPTFLGLPVARALEPAGCPACAGSGYAGRFLLTEALEPTRGDLPRLLLDHADSHRLEAAAIEAGMISRWHHAAAAVEAGFTSPAEVRRTLGTASP